MGESFRVITCLVCAPSVRAPCINRKLTTVKAKAKRMLSLKCDADAEQFVATADLSTFDLLSGFSGIMYLTPHERGGLIMNADRQAIQHPPADALNRYYLNQGARLARLAAIVRRLEPDESGSLRHRRPPRSFRWGMSPIAWLFDALARARQSARSQDGGEAR